MQISYIVHSWTVVDLHTFDIYETVYNLQHLTLSLKLPTSSLQQLTTIISFPLQLWASNFQPLTSYFQSSKFSLQSPAFHPEPPNSCLQLVAFWPQPPATSFKPPNSSLQPADFNLQRQPPVYNIQLQLQPSNIQPATSRPPAFSLQSPTFSFSL